jgi:hypothetical protein
MNRKSNAFFIPGKRSLSSRYLKGVTTHGSLVGKSQRSEQEALPLRMHTAVK